MTQDEKLDLILNEVQNMKSDIEEIKKEQQEIKQDQQEVKNDIRIMKDFVVNNKEKLETHTHEIEIGEAKTAN